MRGEGRRQCWGLPRLPLLHTQAQSYCPCHAPHPFPNLDVPGTPGQSKELQIAGPFPSHASAPLPHRGRILAKLSLPEGHLPLGCHGGRQKGLTGGVLVPGLSPLSVSVHICEIGRGRPPSWAC